MSHRQQIFAKLRGSSFATPPTAPLSPPTSKLSTSNSRGKGGKGQTTKKSTPSRDFSKKTKKLQKGKEDEEEEEDSSALPCLREGCTQKVLWSQLLIPVAEGGARRCAKCILPYCSDRCLELDRESDLHDLLCRFVSPNLHTKVAIRSLSTQSGATTPAGQPRKELVALRAFQPGELIWREDPLLYSPILGATPDMPPEQYPLFLALTMRHLSFTPQDLRPGYVANQIHTRLARHLIYLCHGVEGIEEPSPSTSSPQKKKDSCSPPFPRFLNLMHFFHFGFPSVVKFYDPQQPRSSVGALSVSNSLPENPKKKKKISVAGLCGVLTFRGPQGGSMSTLSVNVKLHHIRNLWSHVSHELPDRGRAHLRQSLSRHLDFLRVQNRVRQESPHVISKNDDVMRRSPWLVNRDKNRDTRLSSENPTVADQPTPETPTDYSWVTRHELFEPTGADELNPMDLLSLTLLMTNAMEVTTALEGRGIFLVLLMLASLLPHQCAPTCVFRWGPYGRFELRAGELGLAPGQVLTISYDATLPGDHKERASQIHSSLGFRCQCQTCHPQEHRDELLDRFFTRRQVDQWGSQIRQAGAPFRLPLALWISQTPHLFQVSTMEQLEHVLITRLQHLFQVHMRLAYNPEHAMPANLPAFDEWIEHLSEAAIQTAREKFGRHDLPLRTLLWSHELITSWFASCELLLSHQHFNDPTCRDLFKFSQMCLLLLETVRLPGDRKASFLEHDATFPFLQSLIQLMNLICVEPHLGTLAQKEEIQRLDRYVSSFHSENPSSLCSEFPLLSVYIFLSLGRSPFFRQVVISSSICRLSSSSSFPSITSSIDQKKS